jgi:hypothetical protein
LALALARGFGATSAGSAFFAARLRLGAAAVVVSLSAVLLLRRPLTGASGLFVTLDSKVAELSCLRSGRAIQPGCAA